MIEIFAILVYFVFLFSFAIFRRKGKLTHSEFVIGSRSLNKWSTALAAHASDMSNWLFMAYPGMIFVKGGAHIWAAVGLVLIMWINWVLVAPRIRIATEKSGSVTLCGFFEKILGEDWPAGRATTSIALFVFYSVYVAAILCGVGLLLHSLFSIPYIWGLVVGIGLVLPLLFFGGYSTLADVDLFQGIFLLCVILFVPIYVTIQSGGAGNIAASVVDSGKSMHLLGSGSCSIYSSVLLMLGWGLGYFGQPHVLTKFMGIKDPSHLKFSMRIGMSWQITSLLASTFVGFVAIAVFRSMEDPQMVFVQLVRSYFPPFISGIFLCAIIAAVINSMSSMLLVLSTTISEDLFKRFSKKEVSESGQLIVSRVACLASALLAFLIALPNFASINQLVEYAWSGLGATFGPLLIASLFAPRITKRSASLGMLLGGFFVCMWPLLRTGIPPLIIAFPSSLAIIYIDIYLSGLRRKEVA